MESGLIDMFLPKELLEHFDVKAYRELGDIKTKRMFYEIDLEEYNKLPSGYQWEEYESKGFCSTARIQDFPIRGKALYLNIKRRRWRSKSNKKHVIKNDFSFIVRGARLTQELSDFLKSANKFKRRYD
jgi:hypothetical protein